MSRETMNTTDTAQPISYEGALRAAFDHAMGYLEALDEARVGSSATPQELRRGALGRLPETGTRPEAVIEELVGIAGDGLVRSGSGRFFAWVIGGSVPAAMAADWLVGAWDQNAALHSCSPAAAVIEEACGVWLKQLLRLPEQAGFALVSGGQMANATCLAAARNEVLHRAGWDVETRGLCGAPAVRVLCSDERHGSIDRAIRLLGLGTDALVKLATDDLGRIDVGALRSALAAAPEAPTIVLVQAGQINTGAYDDFGEIVPLAKSREAWVHVDGAFGLWAATSARHRHRLAGVEDADSWAVDGHKWLNVPFDSGYAFVADPVPLRQAMSHRASYLTHSTDSRDQMDWNPEWSRRARGFPTWAAIRQLGRQGIADLVERTCDHAAALVSGLGALPGVEVVCVPQVNQGLVRFLDPHEGATDEDHDHRTDQVIAAIVSDGTAFFQGTDWRGRRCMRVSVCNWRTSRDDVERTIDAVERCLTRVDA